VTSKYKILDDLRKIYRKSTIPIGARAELEQLHAAFAEICREQGVELDENAVTAMLVALTAAESMRETLMENNAIAQSVAAMHDAMINIHGITPSRYLMSALLSAPAPKD
jgi:hypothetical protein